MIDLSAIRKLRDVRVKVAVLGVISLLYSCANIVQPSGGPKDTTPPKVEEAIPADQSVNFNSSKIVFTFDEYFQLQDINNQFFISPPLKTPPDFTVKNKTLTVTFEDSLRPNTTYNINFGEAIKDINEGNVLSNFTYAFSTGTYIDSLSLLGNVKNAATLQAEKGVLVMLYDEVVDSLPMKKLPIYYTKCDAAGNFKLNNLKGGDYTIIALNDKNSNLLFDLPEEELVGFLDTTVSPYYIPKPVAVDTTASDSASVDSLTTNAEKDRLKAGLGGGLKQAQKDIQLWTFLEEKSLQYLKKGMAVQHGRLAFIYNTPVETLHIKPLNIEIENMGWAFREFSELRDTVFVWMPEAEDEEGTGVIPEVDTLMLEVQADDGKKDTVEIKLMEKGEKALLTGSTKGIRKNVVKEEFKFTLSAPGKGKVQHPNRGFEVRFNHPVVYSDIDKIELREDSIKVNCKTSHNPEALRSFLVDYAWKPGKNYELFIPPGALRDFFGMSNDSFLVSFKGGNIEEFANLILNLELPETSENYAVQLLSDKDKLIEEKSLEESGVIKFELLQPGVYKLKLIYDRNNNKKWDTGNYLQQKQPEKIVVYPDGNITIRPNWDVEVEWNLLE